MSARYDHQAEGLLERFTGSTGFTIMLALSLVIVAPTLLVGAIRTPIEIAAGTPAEWVPVAMLALGGFLGIVGWLRSLRHDHEMWHGRIEVTLTLLAIGIAAALGGIATPALETSMKVGTWSVSKVPWLAVIFVAAHAVVILRAFGLLLRLPREYANRTGIRFDSLPVTFLLFGIAQLTAVILIAARF